MLTDCLPIGVIPTTDFVRAQGFYEGVLGLQVRSLDQYALVLGVGGGIHIRVVKSADFKPHRFAVMGFEVDDVNAKARELASHGIQLERYMSDQDLDGVWTAPSGAKIAWFKDPDGNLLSITREA